jgi:hypothetical protein
MEVGCSAIGKKKEEKRTAPYRRLRRVKVKLHTLLISAMDEGEWLPSCSGLITPEKGSLMSIG